MAQKSEPKANIDQIQNRAIGECVDGLANNQAVLLKAPTGAGKTRMMSLTIAKVSPKKTLFLTQRGALTEQNEQAFSKWTKGFSTSLGVEGKLDQEGRVVFANVQTVVARIDKLKKYDLLVIDEAHHASETAGQKSNDYADVIAAVRALNPEAKILAASGTPIRPDNKGLHPTIAAGTGVTVGLKELEDAGQIILPNTRQLSILTENGTDMRRAAQEKYDWLSAKDHSGINKALRQARPADFHYQAAQQWRMHAGHMRTIAFEDRIEDARLFAREIQALGVSVAIIDSKQDAEENRRILEAYRRGDIQVLSSVSKIDEGIDVPETKCALILRGTTSDIQYSQMGGRTMRGNRADGGERPMLLDAGASTMIHGAIEQRANVAAYYQHLERGDLEKYRMKGNHYLPHRKGDIGFSPWSVINDRPPIIAMSDAKGTLMLRPRRNFEDRIEFEIAGVREVHGMQRLEMLRGDNGKPITRINATHLERIEGERMQLSRNMIMRLATTPSRAGAGSLHDEKVQESAHRHMASFIKMTEMARSAQR